MIIEAGTIHGNKPWRVFVNGKRAVGVNYIDDQKNVWRKWVDADVCEFKASKITVNEEHLTIHIEEAP